MKVEEQLSGSFGTSRHTFQFSFWNEPSGFDRRSVTFTVVFVPAVFDSRIFA